MNRAGGVKWFTVTSRVIGGALITTGVVGFLSSSAYAHPGGLADDGCHRDSRTGTRHCHRGSADSGSAPNIPTPDPSTDATLPSPVPDSPGSTVVQSQSSVAESRTSPALSASQSPRSGATESLAHTGIGGVGAAGAGIGSLLTGWALKRTSYPRSASGPWDVLPRRRHRRKVAP